MTTDAPAANRATSWRSRYHLIFLAVAYGISWPLWIAAWLLARSTGVGDLLLNEELVWGLLFEGGLASPVLGVSVLALVAVYGPLIAGVIATRVDPSTDLGGLRQRTTRVAVGSRWYLRLALVLLGVAVVPGMVMLAVVGVAGDAPSLTGVASLLGIFFALQLLTSGTEEVGWRGYLLHKLLPGRDLWDAGWAVGVPWALWHLPIVLILFAQQGMPPVAIAGSLAGFGIGIVAASILHTWFYANTGSVFLAILAHAAFNTVPLGVGLFLDAAFVTVLISQLLLWAVVLAIVTHAKHAVPPRGRCPYSRLCGPMWR